MEYEEFLDNIKELASGLVEVYELKYSEHQEWPQHDEGGRRSGKLHG